MKIRKLKGDWRNEAVLMCQTITALKVARDVSMGVPDNADFQNRCTDAVVALANRLMEEHVERFYEPETKKFKVTFDVQRSGTFSTVVEAKDEAEAKSIARNAVGRITDVHFDEVPTEVVATNVVNAEEVSHGQEL